MTTPFPHTAAHTAKRSPLPCRAPARLAFCLLLSATSVHAQSAHTSRLGNFGQGEGEAQAVFAAGTLVYFGVGAQVRIASFADPQNPAVMAHLALSEKVADLTGVEIDGRQHLAVVGGPRLFLIDVDNPFAPQLAAALPLGGNGSGVTSRGTIVHVAAGEAGYKIFDAAVPALLASVDSLAYCASVALAGDVVAVAAGTRSHLLDTAQPARPVWLGKITAAAGAYQRYVGLHHGHAYVCDDHLGLQIFNVADPARPQFVAAAATGPRVARVVFAENLAYVANEEEGIRIFDISQPATPLPLGWIDTPGSAAALVFVADQEPPPPPILQEQVYDAGSLNYLLFRALDTRALREGKFPLLISLHGIGERGSDLQRLKADGLPRLLDGNNSFPFYVISPQCPARTEWYYDRTDTLVKKLIDKALTLYPVDRRRVYLTGYSMGGIGAWDLGIRYPNLFAALAPIASRGEEGWNVCAMAEIPVWAFHGERDTVVPLAAGLALVNRLRACGGEVTFTIYPNTGHDAWNRTYSNPQLYDWLLSKSR